MPPGEDLLATERNAHLASACDINPKLIFVLPHNDHLMGKILKTTRYLFDYYMLFFHRLYFSLGIVVPRIGSVLLYSNGKANSVASRSINGRPFSIENSSSVQVGHDCRDSHGHSSRIEVNLYFTLA